jgi:hypothetical protein
MFKFRKLYNFKDYIIITYLILILILKLLEFRNQPFRFKIVIS